MSKKLTVEQVRNFIEIESESGCKLKSEEYINNNTKLNMVCKCGQPFEKEYGNFKFGNQRLCNACAKEQNLIKQRFTIEQVREILLKYGFELLSKEYINSKTNLIYKDCDGYFYYSTLDTFRRSKKGKRFHPSNPYTIQNIKLWCILNNKPFKLISDVYISSTDQLLWQCLKEECGEIFKNDWNHISNGNGCGVCYGCQVTQTKCLANLNPELASEWHPTKNGSLTPFMVSEFCNTKVWWKCNKCNHEWPTSIAHRNFDVGTGCPKCQESHAERIITKYLDENLFKFQSQYRFKDCINKRPLPFDFGLLDTYGNLKLLVEYDGELHYKPYRNVNNAQAKLEQTQYHDAIKNNYCIKNKIPLLRIPYWEFKNIEEILIDVLVNGNMDSKFFVK